MLRSVIFIICTFAIASVSHSATCSMETVCSQKTVCRVICAAAGGAVGASVGGGVGAGAGVGAGSQVCSELCDLVPDCQNRYTCDPYLLPEEKTVLESELEKPKNELPSESQITEQSDERE